MIEPLVPVVSETRDDRIARQVKTLIRQVAADTTIPSTPYESAKSMLKSGTPPTITLVRANSLVPSDTSAKLVESCEQVPEHVQALWQDAADSLTESLQSHGINFRVTTNFTRDASEQLASQDAANGIVPLQTIFCTTAHSRFYGQFENENRILTTQLSDENTPFVFVHEAGHAVWASPHVMNYYDDLPNSGLPFVPAESRDPAVIAYLCNRDQSNTQSGSVMSYPTQWGQAQCAPAESIGLVSRQMGPFDIAVAQMKINGNVDPALEQQIIDEVIEKAKHVPEDLGKALGQSYGARVGSHFLAMFAGQLVRRSIDLAIARNASPELTDNQRKALRVVAEALSCAVQAGMLMLSRHPLEAGVVAGSAFAINTIAQILSPEALSALTAVIGPVNIGYFIYDALVGDPTLSAMGLIGGFLGRESAQLFFVCIEHMLKPQGTQQRALQDSGLLTTGNFYPDFSGPLGVLQDWSQQIRAGIDKYVNFNCLRSNLYKQDDAEAQEVTLERVKKPEATAVEKHPGEVRINVESDSSDYSDDDSSSDDESSSSSDYHTPVSSDSDSRD